MLVVEALSRLPGLDHGPSEIAEVTGLNVTVVYRILQSGLGSLFARRPAGRYRLGPGAVRVGMQAMASVPGPEAFRPVLKQLSLRLDGLVLLWVLAPYGRPRRVLYDIAPGRYDLDALGLSAAELMQWSRTLRIDAAGRVIAAHLPAPRAASVLEEPIPAAAGIGVLRNDAFLASLSGIRRAGHAVGREEIPGWTSIAAPVLWGEAAYGAVAILRPTSLMPQDLRVPIAGTTAAADRLSLLVAGGAVRATGYRGA